MADVLHKLQPELLNAEKVGFENVNDFFAVLALPSFCSLAKGWRQHQLYRLLSDFDFLLLSAKL